MFCSFPATVIIPNYLSIVETDYDNYAMMCECQTLSKHGRGFMLFECMGLIREGSQVDYSDFAVKGRKKMKKAIGIRRSIKMGPVDHSVCR